MKNTSISLLACACLVIAAFLGGMYVGRSIRGVAIAPSVLTSQAIPLASSSPATAATATPSTATQPTGKININTADIHTLMTLPGIGEAYAQRIIDYRTANGPFQQISDIMNVSGIGEKRYAAIKDLITTGG